MPSIAEVYDRYHLPYRVDEARGGWISTHCPYCAGSADFHLGYSAERGYFRCWRCGFHPTIDTLVALLGVDRAAAASIYVSLSGSGPPRSGRAARDREAQTRVGHSRYRHPSDTGAMRPHHLRYLERRGFDPEEVGRRWGVLGTGPMSDLDGIDYRHRILIPVRWDGAEASFQARDVTDRSDLKYISCPPDREVRHHKHVLYGRQEEWGEVGIVVEGVTDVWRLGSRACAVFGVGYRAEQVVEIARHFRRVSVVFDAEPAAQARARRLAATLRLRLGEDVRVVDLGGGVDPGSMAQDDADHLVRELTR